MGIKSKEVAGVADWQAIKTEYITTDTSYRKLAQKHGIGYQAICHKSKEEGWIAQREQYRNETVTKTVEVIVEQEVDRARRILTVADKLLDKIEAMVDTVEPVDMSPKSIRALTAAVKDLREIQGVKSELDSEEQRARIANLRKQAEKDVAGGTDVIEVVFAAGPEEWNE